MKRRPVFFWLFLVALSLAAFGQENLGRGGKIPSEQRGATTDEPAHIYVVGEVVNPGEYVMSQPLTIMDAISLAAGFKKEAATHGYLHRRVKEGESLFDLNQEKLLENPQIASLGEEVIDIDLTLLFGGDRKQNIKMEAGDVLVIPRKNSYYYFVVGGVGIPGAHEIKSGQTILASQAISIAGGPLKTAKMSKGILIRYVDGKREEMKVDYAAILRGEEEDFEVFPDDIIFIPGSHPKTPSLPYDFPPNWRDILNLPPMC